MGGPPRKASKQWQTKASSFLTRHFSAVLAEVLQSDADARAAAEAGESADSTRFLPDSSDTFLPPTPCPATAAAIEPNSDSEEEDLRLSLRRAAKTPPTERKTPPADCALSSAPNWRPEFERKVNQLRALLRWLAKTQFPIEKQTGLAHKLGLSGPELSHFLTGNSFRGKMGPQELDRNRRLILRKLQAAGLPIVIEAPVAEPLTGPCTRGLNITPPTVSAAPQLSAVSRPLVSLLTLNLAEAPGSQGGEVQILDIGTPVDDGRWQLMVGGRILFLRKGLRGLRTLGARSALSGRTFEFCVEVLNCPSEPSYHGGPLWVAREYTGSVNYLAASRILGRARGADGTRTGWSSPQLLWKAITDAYQVESRLNGLVHCGLTHPALQDTLDAVMPETAPAPATPFGERKGKGGLNPDGSWLRQLGALAGDSFVDAMRSVCPSNPAAAFEQLLKRKSFQLKWLPEEMREGLSQKAVEKAMLETPLIKGLVDTYHTMQGFKLKRQHLSIVAPHLPYDTVQELFGVSRCECAPIG